MTYYQQTLIIPKPRQHLNESGRTDRYSGRSAAIRNHPDRELNSILAFFD